MSPTGYPENGPVFLIKEENVISEQIFLFSFQVADLAYSDIQSAAILIKIILDPHLVIQV